MTKMRSLAPALMALLLAVLATVIAATAVRREVSAVEQRQFQAEATAVADAIAKSMRTDGLALHAGAGLVTAVGEVSAEQWQKFVADLRLAQSFPGFQGLGFAQVIHRDDVAALEQRQHAAGNTVFNIRPKDNRETYIPIVLLEPQDWRNQRAMGFDMYSEPARREAMELARDSGDPALTAKIVLVQETDSDVQPGTLMYLPVYEDGAPIGSIEERRARLRGYTYMAMRMDDLIKAVLEVHMPAALDAFDITIFDGARPHAESVLFQSTVPQVRERPNRLSYPSSLEIAGRTWTIQVEAPAPILQASDQSRPWIVLGAGLIISALIAAIAGFQAMARADLASSRQALAAEVAERKKAQEAAEMANNELIHRVKNTLAVVSAISAQTIRYSATLQDFNVAFRERLAALGRVQDLLRPGAAADPDLAQLIQQLLQPYMEKGHDRLSLLGPPVKVPKNDVVLFSLAFNELATNAIKYGAWSVPGGRVIVAWEFEDDADGAELIELTWRETGGPSVATAAHKKGFGTAVLQFAIERAMRGTIVVEHHPRGISYRISIPKRPAGQTAAHDYLSSAG